MGGCSGKPYKEPVNNQQKQKENSITQLQPNGAGYVPNKRVVTLQGEEEEEKHLEGNPDVVKRQEKKKFAQIAAISEKEEIFENIIKNDKAKSSMDQAMILEGFKSHFLLNQLNEDDKQIVINKMFYCVVPDNQFVFKQNDMASSYFLIERGECQIIINEEVKKTLKKGETFGELALLYNAPRSASVKTIGDCGFWGIDRNTFKKVIEDIQDKEYEENSKFLMKIRFFEFLTQEQKNATSNALITLTFKKGEHIVNEGDMANSFFIIKKGTVSAIQNQIELRKMIEGDSFGEQALFKDSIRGATVKAIDEEVKCLALGRDDITRILGDKIQSIMYNNSIKWAFESNPTLSKLTKIQIEKILLKITQLAIKNEEIYIKSNDSINKIFIVLEGEVKSQSSDTIKISKGQMFGHQQIIDNQINATISETLFMEAKNVPGEVGLVGEITFVDFFKCIGGPLEEVLKKNATSHEVKYMQKQEHQSKKDYSHVTLNELIYIKKLGAGQFGNVFLVYNKQDDNYYALKQISKQQIIKQNLENHLNQELQTLSAVQFPLIMGFARTLKDKNFIYFLLEYIKGMELFDVIRQIGLLNTQNSQFYIGSLLLCMEFLHTNHIIYRDIKPENVMIDSKGSLKLIDLGTSKNLKDKNGRTFTVIGTPHYMAPEIIRGKGYIIYDMKLGYSYSVDLWSIGICFFEFMCGFVPFAEYFDDPYEIYEVIQHSPGLAYPSFFKDRKAKKLMEQLLNKTPELRLGQSFASLKANPWFDNFDWDKLMEGELKSPYIPPSDKIISDKEVQKMQQAAKTIQNEIKVEKDQIYKPEKAKNPNWDSQY